MSNPTLSMKTPTPSWPRPTTRTKRPQFQTISSPRPSDEGLQIHLDLGYQSAESPHPGVLLLPYVGPVAFPGPSSLFPQHLELSLSY